MPTACPRTRLDETVDRTERFSAQLELPRQARIENVQVPAIRQDRVHANITAGTVK